MQGTNFSDQSRDPPLAASEIAWNGEEKGTYNGGLKAKLGTVKRQLAHLHCVQVAEISILWCLQHMGNIQQVNLDSSLKKLPVQG